MAPLKQFVCDSYIFPIVIEYFALINIRKLEYDYCCVVAILNSFDIFILYLLRRVYLHILIYIITMPVNLNQYRGIVGTFNSRYLIRFRNSYQYVKCHLNDIVIALSVISFSCSILTTISIFFLSLSLGIFVCHTIKIFLFSRFRKIKGVFTSIFVFTFFVSFLSRKLPLSGDIETNPGPRRNLSNHFTICHWNLNSISAYNFAKVQL